MNKLSVFSMLNNFNANKLNIRNYNNTEDWDKLLAIYDAISNDYSINKNVILMGLNNSINLNNSNHVIDTWSFLVSDSLNYVDQEVTFVISTTCLLNLEDPRAFLLGCKKLFLLNQSFELFIIDNCSSKNLRDWSSEQFKQFLELSGFNILNITSEYYKIEYSIDSGLKCLAHYNLNTDMLLSDLLLVTTEDATIKPTGGIGTYIKNIKKLNPHLPSLFCDLFYFGDNFSKNDFTPKDILDGFSYEDFFYGIGLIEIIKVIMYLLPNLRTIEFQDYQSIGFRLIQAKQTGILPRYLHLRVFLHGNYDYVNYGIQNKSSQNYSKFELLSIIKDNYIFSKSDEVFVPSNYLVNNLLINEFGYSIDAYDVVRLPFDLDLLPNYSCIQIKQIKNIAFIGKYNDLKGFPDFLESMVRLLEEGTYGIKTIYSIAPGEPDENSYNRLSKLIDYKPVYFMHNELLSYIEVNKHDTLFIIPSRGENYPFVILEQLLIGTMFVAYDSGGIPEVIENIDGKKLFLCENNITALYEKIKEVLLIGDYSVLNNMIISNREYVIGRQYMVNNRWRYSKQMQQIDRSNLTLSEHKLKNISLCIPVYNTKLDYLMDLVDSIKKSSVLPDEILFIDDGSSSDYVVKLKILLQDFLNDYNYSVVTQPNKGLAGARNTGLRTAKNEYIFFLDSDDALLPNTLLNCILALDGNKDLCIVTGFAYYFQSYNDIICGNNALYRNSNYWKPIGNELAKSYAFYENQFITSNCMVRKNVLLNFGGWDESSKSTWEDYALYFKLSWSGYKFSLIPHIGYLYRNTPNSMSKTYSLYFGRRRLIRNLPFSRLDANVIFGLIHANKEVISSNNLALTHFELKLLSFLRRVRVFFNKNLLTRKVYYFIKAKFYR